MKKVRYEGNKVFIASSHGEIAKRFDNEIAQILDIEQGCVVLFKLEGEKTPERNIICLDDAGKLLWQVQDPDEWRTGKKFTPRDLFYAVWLNDSGALWAGGRSSHFRIDAATGKILEEVYTK